MTKPAYTVSDYVAAFQALLPSGRIWDRSSSSALTQTLTALMPTTQRMSDRALNLLLDSPSGNLAELLPEWEASLGLPDPCLTNTLVTTNYIRNSVAASAVLGTPGTPPTNWVITSNAAGIQSSIVGAGTDPATGYGYIDVRFLGTNSQVAGAYVFPGIYFEAITNIPAVQNQVWSGAVNVQLVSGSVAPVTFCLLSPSSFNSSGTFLASGPLTINPTAVTQRYTQTWSSSSATTAFISLRLEFQCNGGVAQDFTVRMSAPQLEQASFASPYIQTVGAASTRTTPISATTVQRVAQVIARFAGQGGQSVPFLQNYAATLGYPITIDEFAPFQADRSTADASLWSELAAYMFRVNSPSTVEYFFSAGISTADDPLFTLGSNVVQCEIDRLKPAHTQSIYALTGNTTINPA